MRPAFAPGELDQSGLNLQAVFDLSALPDEMLAQLGEEVALARYRQLILIGHGGKAMWSALKASGLDSEHPIDDFTIAAVHRWAVTVLSGGAYEIVYPGLGHIDLQALGKMVGWHHDSPFRVGINQSWGPWFAYRAVVLADSDFSPSLPQVTQSPCASCAQAPCVSACPARAMTASGFSLSECTAYRQAADSECQTQCLARSACPVGVEHRYDPAQMAHTYAMSLRWIKGWV